jgi:hypothetical protein
MSSIDFITIPHSEGGRKSLVYSYTNPIPFFFFCGTGVWTQGFHTSKAGTLPLKCTLIHFALAVMELGGVSWTISLGWPRAVILPFSASHIAGLTGVSHQHTATDSTLKHLEFLDSVEYWAFIIQFGAQLDFFTYFLFLPI